MELVLICDVVYIVRTKCPAMSDRSVMLKGMWHYIRAKFRNVTKDRTKQ